ncbi:PLD nuclease N-terminal domain-containing protein [Paenibacillus marinisediminis]
MNTWESLDQVPWAAIAPLIVIQLVLVIFALISLVRADRVNGPKWMWALIIVLGQMFGSIVYFIFGKKER